MTAKKYEKRSTELQRRLTISEEAALFTCVSSEFAQRIRSGSIMKITTPCVDFLFLSRRCVSRSLSHYQKSNQNPTLYKVQNPGNERRQIYKALASIQVDAIFHTRYTVKFRKQAPPCISRSKYKPQNSKLVTQKTLR